MSAGFTPGPWRRGKSERFRNDIMAADGLSVAHMAEYLPAYRALSEANANLIAAAPALYEAARVAAQAFRTLEEVAVANLEHDKARNFIKLGDQCRAALAQARGDLVDPLEQVRS